LVYSLFTISLLILFSGNALAQQVTPHESQNQNILRSQNQGSANQTMGRPSPSNSSEGIRYIPTESHYLCQIDFRVKTNGSPTDGLNINIYQGGTTLTNGTLIWTSENTVNSADIGATEDVISFWFGSVSPPGACIAVVAGETYFIELNRTGSDHATNNYSIYYDTNDLLPNGESLGFGDRNGQWSVGTWPAVDIYGIEDGSGINTDSEVPDFCASLGILAGSCNLFASLFGIDAEFAEDEFSDTYDSLVSKAPFAYIFPVFDLNLSSTSASMDTPTISIPLYASFSGSLIMDNSFDWSDDGIIGDLVGLIRPTFALGLWFVLIFYIVGLVRHVL